MAKLLADDMFLISRRESSASSRASSSPMDYQPVSFGSSGGQSVEEMNIEMNESPSKSSFFNKFTDFFSESRTSGIPPKKYGQEPSQSYMSYAPPSQPTPIPTHEDITQCAMLFLHDHGYTVDQKIGEGKYGSVYILCKKDNCDYVVKYGKLNDVNNFEKEVRIQEMASKIKNNKGVRIAPKIYDYGLCNNYYYIIQERIHGKTLHSLTTTDQVNMFDVKNIIIDAINTIGLLFINNIIHYDIHVGNMMWDEKSNSIRIIDYGMADVYNLDDYQTYQLDVIESIMRVIIYFDNEASRKFLTPATSSKYSKFLLDINKVIYTNLYKINKQLFKKVFGEGRVQVFNIYMTHSNDDTLYMSSDDHNELINFVNKMLQS